jgi:hypothetical protein
MMLGSFSCSEDEWLKEEPLSFYATENSYTTVQQFQKALNYLYNQVCSTYFNLGDQTAILHYADLAHGGTDMIPTPTKFNNTRIWLVPTNYVVSSYWDIAYRSIGNANTIINRITLSTLSDADKAVIEGEALFFRAYWYNFLANLYGGVPVTTEETSAPRTDYVTTPRAGVYGQARTDLERAITLLTTVNADITAVDDGKISIQAAQHLLTEVYISCGEYGKAITTASAVIDHPSMGLMTSRFGNFASKADGNVYWDLFQHGNQNRRTSGNRESLLVLQYDYQNSGSPLSSNMPRNLLPYSQGLQVAGASGGFAAAFISGGGNSVPQNHGGRGIGVLHPTDYFLNTIWTDGTNDLRNSPLMIVRDMQINNPLAAGFQKWIMADGIYNSLSDEGKMRQFYPFVMKFSRSDDLPDACYYKNPDGSIKTDALGAKYITSTAGQFSYKDEYLFRLGGTYLLRAEAYIRNNQPGEALADINTLRDRAHATRAVLSDINLDYLMDEQMRELYFENFRTETLMRMSKYVDRTRTCNPKIGGYVDDHHNLYPIPFSEIERNALGKIDQNPGYEN